MIRNIIFDFPSFEENSPTVYFGGVILKHKSTLMEGKIAEVFSISPTQALEIWKIWKPKLMTGQISSEKFLKLLKIELNSNKPFPQILKEWDDIYTREAKDVDWKLLGFIEELKSKFGVYLFTDTIDTHDQYNPQRGIYEKFTRVFKSHEEGFTKINDDAFLNVLKKIDAKPEECIFIDDLEINVKRAENLGIKGIVYKNLADLKEKLSNFLLDL